MPATTCLRFTTPPIMKILDCPTHRYACTRLCGSLLGCCDESQRVPCVCTLYTLAKCHDQDSRPRRLGQDRMVRCCFLPLLAYLRGALNEEMFVAGSTKVCQMCEKIIFTEINYNPEKGRYSHFVEVKNIATVPVVLTGATIKG